MLFKRADGTLLKDAPTLRKMMPYLMRTRNECVVYFEQVIDVTDTLAWLEKTNAGRKGNPINLFQVILCAMLRIFTLRPQLNRFVVGRRLFARNDIEFSFAIKKEFHDDGQLKTTKITFDPSDTLEKVSERAGGAIAVGRSDKKLQSDIEVDLITKLPRFVVRFLMWLAGTLDYFNLLPGAMIKPDPLYASMFLANLGSVGLDSAYHHLYEYGTIPFFAVVGRIKKGQIVTPEGQVVVRDTVSIKFSFDERITDGLYCSKSMKIFTDFVEKPETLDPPPAKP